MKNIYNIIIWLEKVLGVISIVKGFNFKSITIYYSKDNPTATVTIAFDDITTIEQTVINAVIKIIEQYESIVKIIVQDNNIIITVKV
jgi:hypothetical protein